MDLTSPHISRPDVDAVFPGENWFFYWRTSASLWEGKLASSGRDLLFLPLYWGFHTENGETFDFGENKPEADLGRLFKILQKTGKTVVVLLPLTPVPFEPNGGLPSFLARNPVQDVTGLTQAYLDAEGNVHKIHSFYDPRVYQAWRKWVWQLSQFLTQKGIAVEVRGLKGHWMDGSMMHSFLEDHSETFQAGFLRYLKQQKLPIKILGDGHEAADLPEGELEVQEGRYRQLITDLYAQTASESLGGYWGGENDYGFLGGGAQDIFPRSCEAWPHQVELFQDIWTQLQWNLLPSSVLLSGRAKKGVLEKFLQDFMTLSHVRASLDQHMSEELGVGNFTPLIFFEVFWQGDLEPRAWKTLEDVGFVQYAEKEFAGCWRWRRQMDLQKELEDSQSHKLKLFFGRYLDKTRLEHVLRLFLNGQKIVLDRSRLGAMLEKKLQLFLTENDLQVQNVNHSTPMGMVRLGEGMLLLYDGAKLATQDATQKLSFWDNISKYLQMKHLRVKGEAPLFFTWKTRETSSFELNYNEVRRVSIYNPTNIRMRCQIQGSKNFAFLKVVDPIMSQAKSTPMGVDMEIMSGGSLSLDFGHFEV